MEDAKLRLAKIEWQIDTLVEQFHAIAEENQTLDWDIPSEYNRLLENVDRMNRIEAKMRALDPSVHAKEHAKRAVRGHFAAKDKVSFRKKHLTLIWSKE